MKIALIGYGKMGHEVEKTATALGHSIGLVIDNEEDWLNLSDQINSCDVAIEFTAPHIAFGNITRCLNAGIPVVAGTTGWFDRLEEIKSLCRQRNGAVFYASNFSMGVNILFHLNRKLAGIMNLHPQFIPSITETHHLQKLDAPSGTAITLASDIIANHPQTRRWTMEPAAEGELHISSIREGSIPGIHSIDWTSEADKITIRHEAFNRQGFAIGAISAAAWLIGKKGVFTMDDMFQTE